MTDLGIEAAPAGRALSGLDEMSGVTGYLYRMMTRTMDGVVMFDDVGRVVFANSAFGRLVGRQPGRLVRHSFLGLLRESERPLVLQRWRRLHAGQEESYRVHLATPGGERLVVVVQHRVDAGDGLHHAYVRDLTESAELSRQLHELAGLAGITRAYANIADPRQVTLHLVTELAHLLGVEKCYLSRFDPVTDEVAPLLPAYGIADADLQAVHGRLSEAGHLAHMVQTGQPHISNDATRDPLLSPRLTRSLGVTSLLTAPLVVGRRVLGFVTVINRFGAGFNDDDVRPLLIFAGQVAMVLDNARLVSELAEEKDLAVARAGQLEALVNSIVDAVFIVRVDGMVVRANDAGQRLTGLSLPEALRPVHDYIHLLRIRGLQGHHQEASTLPWMRSLAGETVHDEELLLRPAGRATDIVVSVSSSPVRAADGSVALAVVIARDVTAIRELQRQKDEFLSIASHEMRTPLTTLRGYTQQVLRMLQRDALDRERAMTSLGLVIRQVERLASLTSDLVDVSRIETGHLRLDAAPADLVAMAREVLERYQSSNQSPRHRLMLHADDAVTGTWDLVRLEQVLTNLVDNAIKYSPDGGRVDVSVHWRGDRAILAVRDEGIGIATDKLPNLFQAFYRVESLSERRTPGLGLGLHIASELVRLHGGDISVESHTGRGSTFTVSLPIHSPAVERPGDQSLGSSIAVSALSVTSGSGSIPNAIR